MKPLLVVDSPKRWPLEIPGAELVSAYQYLSDPELANGPGRKVFNLCRSLRYQETGYYVSLLADARGHRALPSVSAIQDLKLAPVLKIASQDLDEIIQRDLKRIRADSFELSIYFGRNLSAAHDRLATAIFNAFSVPLLRARFENDGRWRLTGVRVIGLADVPDSHRPFLVEQAERYLKRTPRKGRAAKPTRYDLAILRNSPEPPAGKIDREAKGGDGRDVEGGMSPSNDKAIRAFIAAGESVGIRCEIIGREAYGRLAEFDALFIRETTYVNHYTYRFARRAAAEGMVVVDDPRSIVRCTNKVFLAETLARHRLAMPKTLILSEENAAEGIRSLGFPCVVKRPDSAFSAGVYRVDSAEGLEAGLSEQFKESDLLIAQEYVPTEFDWRVGVLGGKPLFVCRYGMAPGHWQIVKHAGDSVEEGDAETMAVEDAPRDVIKLAVRAANLMGDGLYGVDLKTVRGKAMVIEVNDNPNLDAGIEDRVLGEELYKRVMEYFFWKLESR